MDKVGTRRSGTNTKKESLLTSGGELLPRTLFLGNETYDLIGRVKVSIRFWF